MHGEKKTKTGNKRKARKKTQSLIYSEIEGNKSAVSCLQSLGWTSLFWELRWGRRPQVMGAGQSSPHSGCNIQIIPPVGYRTLPSSSRRPVLWFRDSCVLSSLENKPSVFVRVAERQLPSGAEQRKKSEN